MIHSRRRGYDGVDRSSVYPRDTTHRSLRKRTPYKDILLQMLYLQKEQFLNRFGWIRSRSDLMIDEPSPAVAAVDNGRDYKVMINDLYTEIHRRPSSQSQRSLPSESESQTAARKRLEGGDLEESANVNNSSSAYYCNMDTYLENLGAPKIALICGISLLLILPSVFFHRQLMQILDSSGSLGCNESDSD